MSGLWISYIMIDLILSFPLAAIPTSWVKEIESWTVSGYTIRSWRHYFQSYSIEEWAAWNASAGTWSYSEWLQFLQEYYRDGGSALAWTLHHLGYKVYSNVSTLTSRM